MLVTCQRMLPSPKTLTISRKYLPSRRPMRPPTLRHQDLPHPPLPFQRKTAPAATICCFKSFQVVSISSRFKSFPVVSSRFQLFPVVSSCFQSFSVVSSRFQSYPVVFSRFQSFPVISSRSNCFQSTSREFLGYPSCVPPMKTQKGQVTQKGCHLPPPLMFQL